MIPNTNEPNSKIKLSFLPTTLTFDENLEFYRSKAEDKKKSMETQFKFKTNTLRIRNETPENQNKKRFPFCT